MNTARDGWPEDRHRPTRPARETAMIDHKRLRELIKLMVANDLTEIDLQGEAERVTLKRGGGGSPPVVTHVPAAAPPPVPVPPTTVEADEEKKEQPAILSPMVGTFYAAQSPDAASFVKVGDTVEPETQVGIVEAMKVFNEIKAEASGVIEKILVTNGEAVEFDQPLFLIRPH